MTPPSVCVLPDHCLHHWQQNIAWFDIILVLPFLSALCDLSFLWTSVEVRGSADIEMMGVLLLLYDVFGYSSFSEKFVGTVNAH